MWNDRIIEALRMCTSEELDLREVGLGTVKLDSMENRRSAVDDLLNQIKHREPEDRARSVETVVAATGAGPPPTLMMNDEQVRSLIRRGMEVGAHTVSHPILTRLDSSAAGAEIRESKAQLEQLTGHAVRLFAYPNGVPKSDYAAEHVQMVRDAGFDAAVSTAWGAASVGDDLYQLPRFTPWDRTRLRRAAGLESQPQSVRGRLKAFPLRLPVHWRNQ